MRYLTDRGIADTSSARSGPSSATARPTSPSRSGRSRWPGREKLDNLVFVVNCNLQRLDGPVHGNGKIIQELETIFRGAGWNVIKVIWGDRWDPLLEADHDGLLVRRMEEAVDGEYQVYKARDGKFVREHFFGKYPELAERVKDMTDEEIWDAQPRRPRRQEGLRRLRRRPGRDPAADGDPRQDDQGLRDGRGRRGPEHHPPAEEDERGGAARVPRPLRARHLRRGGRADISFHRPAEDSPEMRYMRERREALGGYLPARRRRVDEPLRVPGSRRYSPASSRAPASARSRRRWPSSASSPRCCETRSSGPRVVPIVPDESRTFGMEGMFRQLGIYSHVGQLYEPEDAEQLMFYREDRKGQVLQEGINEAGAFSSWIAAATSYSNHDVQMVPFYVFYSMFGFQRVGDLAWAAGDSRARGFLIGGTAGRTTLNGEGLQHEDGHSHLLASTIPNCVAYDPAYGYELAVIVHDGLRRMIGEQEDVFYYLTVMNENYRHPPIPEGAEEGILRGMHRVREIDGRARCGCSARGRSCARSRPRRSSWARTSASRPTSGASPASPSCAAMGLRAQPRCASPAAEPAGTALGRASAWAASEAPGGRGDRLHARRCPTASAPGSRGATRCSAPTASAAATCAGTCGASSRWTATTSRSPRCGRLRPTAELDASVVSEAIAKYEIDPDAADPARGMSAQEVQVPDIGDFSRRPGDRDPGRPGRRGRRRRAAGHAGVRQGDDGRPGAVRGQGGGAEGRGRRQGVGGRGARSR